MSEEFLIEGGNAFREEKVGPDGKKIRGEPLTRPITLEPDGSNRNYATAELHTMLNDLSKEHKKRYGGQPLFGTQGLVSAKHSIYAGSTRQLMNHDTTAEIPSAKLASYKKEFGDVDTSIHPEHKNSLYELLENLSRHDHTGQKIKLGGYTVEGVKKSGSEIHAMMRHENGNAHQIDFNTVPDDGWSKDEKGNRKGLNDTGRFSTSQHIEDLQNGIKGAAHKMALGAIHDEFKFAMGGNKGGGLSRRDGQNIGSKEIIRNPKSIFKTLFQNPEVGTNAENGEQEHIHSVLGISRLVGRHIDPSRHQKYLDKIREGLSKIPGLNVDHHMQKISEALQSGAASKNGPIPAMKSLIESSVTFSKLGKTQIMRFNSWKSLQEAELTRKGKGQGSC